MESAAAAVGKLFSNAGQTTTQEDIDSGKVSATPNASSTAKASSGSSSTGAPQDTTVEQNVNAPVTHEHVKKEHETREQTVVDRERHQDHYHTTIQPLKDQEVEATKHDHVEEQKSRNINKDTEGDKVKAQVDADRSGFKSTSETQKSESKSKEDTIVGEQVHHHLHETVQPVIEKEVIKPSVTHKTIGVHEHVQEPSVNEGVTTKAPISVNEFSAKSGQTVETTHGGSHAVSDATGVTAKE